MFGQSAFGSTAPTFGAANTTPAFGSTGAATGMFGQAAGAFGAQKPAFGAGTTFGGGTGEHMHINSAAVLRSQAVLAGAGVDLVGRS